MELPSLSVTLGTLAMLVSLMREKGRAAGDDAVGGRQCRYRSKNLPQREWFSDATKHRLETI